MWIFCCLTENVCSKHTFEQVVMITSVFIFLIAQISRRMQYKVPSYFLFSISFTFATPNATYYAKLA